MLPFASRTFRAEGVTSLAWRADRLVDWVSGGRSFSLDGTERDASVLYGYRFDAAVTCPTGRFVAIYERLGTKGLLLDNGKVVREFDRSFYHADAYEFPITLFNHPDGRLLLAHCPDEYCRIEIDEVVTGRRLTAFDDRKPVDFFHSRLAVSPNGKRLLSAGWIWHPWNEVAVFDIQDVLNIPILLDRGQDVTPHSGYERGSACWLDDDTLILGGSGDPENLNDEPGDGDPAPGKTPRDVGVYDLDRRVCRREFTLDEPPGTMFAVGNDTILSLYRHPKLIDLAAGTILHVWDQLNSGLQTSSIIHHLRDDAIPPPMAYDPVGRRFAIACRGTITIIEFL